uniref:Uncharacterized protein n=1 Tax=Photinus pyralis TaxID=7054 RepID=A0A1Y1NHW5_PHOPY
MPATLSLPSKTFLLKFTGLCPVRLSTAAMALRLRSALEPTSRSASRLTTNPLRAANAANQSQHTAHHSARGLGIDTTCLARLLGTHVTHGKSLSAQNRGNEEW